MESSMNLRDRFWRGPAAPSVTQSTGPLTIIPVSDVTPAQSPLPEVCAQVAVEALLNEPPSVFRRPRPGTVALRPSPVEACSRSHDQLIAHIFFHPVVAAIHLAFSDHRPLVLSPDMLWLLVLQGFANHVNANAEKLRSKFVQHEGRATIEVRRDDFVKGSPTNPWPEVFDEFSRRIRAHMGAATHDLLLPNFSTTGAVERAAAEVVLMNAMQSYFSYELHTICGIPQIVLEGATGDWALLAERTHDIGTFGLGWWTETLLPILDEFIAASGGRVNSDFWQSIYKVNGGSGGPYIHGWITAFFPYLKGHRSQELNKNRFLTDGGEPLQELLYPSASKQVQQCWHGVKTPEFPSGLARAPFRWIYFDDSFDMQFLGGFVGVRQDSETLRLRPEIGWAVRDRSAE